MAKFARVFYLSILFIGLGAQSARAENVSQVNESIWVNAPVKSCWEALRSPASCPDRRRIIAVNGTEVLVEETYDNLPVIRSCICIFRETEQPLQRLSYRLVSSTKFKAMKGDWKLMPGKDGGTLVTISSSLETGIHLPFAHKVANDFNTQKCRERLALVKTLAESAEHDHSASQLLAKSN